MVQLLHALMRVLLSISIRSQQTEVGPAAHTMLYAPEPKGDTHVYI
jgi:hypothetical protein